MCQKSTQALKPSRNTADKSLESPLPTLGTNMRVVALLLTFLSVSGGATLSAQAYAAFGFKPAPELTVPKFDDDEVTRLLGILDSVVGGDAEDALWQFARRLQTGQLSASQEAQVLAHLDRLAGAHPSVAAALPGPRRMVTGLMVGKVAPDIVGTDLDGQPFRLRDYRGRVVVLAFSAEWCAICRSQIPYEQFLRDKYKGWPFAMLGVQTGSSREAAREEQARVRTPERSWWDVPGDGESGGPIASAWNVIGWPATYVIDPEGVIQFVDVRDEDLLRAVRQLLATAQRNAHGSSR